MKKIALLLLLLITFASCKTSTMIIMPVQNIQMPAYPPQSYLGEKSKFNSYSNFNSLGMNNYFNNNFKIKGLLYETISNYIIIFYCCLFK